MTKVTDDWSLAADFHLVHNCGAYFSDSRLDKVYCAGCNTVAPKETVQKAKLLGGWHYTRLPIDPTTLDE